jgi:hypothetical protein
MRMRRGCRGDMPGRLGQERHDAATAEIDRQKHQFLHRRALAICEPEHLMRHMQPFVVGANDLARDAHPFADQQFPLVEIAGLDDKGAVLGGVLVAAADADRFEQEISRVIEQHRVIGEVHMAVHVDPFGQDFAQVAVEWRRNGHTRQIHA